MGTTKTASARALIDPHIKREAEAILKKATQAAEKIIKQHKNNTEMNIVREKND